MILPGHPHGLRGAAGKVFSCMMTAGTDFGLSGYATSSFEIGTIDQEPVPGFVFQQLISADGSGGDTDIDFFEDCLSLISGLTVWVDGVEYASNWSGWSFDGELTSGKWPSGGPEFVDTETYLVEIK